MKKQIIFFVAVVGMCIAYNASANVDFRQVWIDTDWGWYTFSSYEYIENCGTRCNEFTNSVSGTNIKNSQASVYKYNSTTEFNSFVWKKGNNGPVLPNPSYSPFWENGKRVYQSDVNTTDIYMENCTPTPYLTFQFKYTAGGSWYTFLFTAFPGCLV